MSTPFTHTSCAHAAGSAAKMIVTAHLDRTIAPSTAFPERPAVRPVGKKRSGDPARRFAHGRGRRRRSTTRRRSVLEPLPDFLQALPDVRAPGPVLRRPIQHALEIL